jgi:hypothetical protein
MVLQLFSGLSIMKVLTKDQRNQLKNIVLQARETSENGARKSLNTLGVESSDAPSYLSTEQRELRRSLKAQAKQLGDKEIPSKPGVITIDHLSEKIAYDQWHRMLFARFLAENHLLISPKHQVSVTIEECNDLAPELGLRDGWQVAAVFASEMLPQIFRADDPSGQIHLAPEDRMSLQQYVKELPKDIFVSDDALGWVYQFWQEQKKEEVNKSEKKIGADELAPVTQLFTEDYMVKFLLHNTLGAWWAGKHLERLKGLKSEEECRKVLSVHGIEWTYLRFIKDEALYEWIPASGIFEGWPKVAKELRILDPSMGSGHFLVFALPILIAFRVEEEGISIKNACDYVINENIFGLELDIRCTQIGAFNLALKSWKIGGYRTLPPMNIACCGLGINKSKEEWLRISNRDVRLKAGLEKLYNLFQQAPILGSLINPSMIQASSLKPKEGDLFSASYAELKPLFEKAIENESNDETVHEMAVTAHGLLKAAEILTGHYTLISTNVPYLTVSKHDDILRDFGLHFYPDSRHDLATMFIERCIPLGLTISVVTPQNWLFLPRYKKLRKKLLISNTWHFSSKLGPKAFETITGEVVKAALVSISQIKPRSENKIIGVDVSKMNSPREKAKALIEKSIQRQFQKDQLSNPDARVILSELNSQNFLMIFADSRYGLRTADGFRFIRKFWEIPIISHKWVPLQSTVKETLDYGGRDQILFWENGEGGLREFADIGLASLQGRDAWGKEGVVVSLMGNLPVTRYTGEFFDNNCAALWPKEPEDLAAIWSFCSSNEYAELVRILDQKMNVTSATLLKVPFDLTRWKKVAAEVYPNGLSKPYSSDPTQWIFNGFPKDSEHILHVAVSRLLNYKWPRQTGSEFHDCKTLLFDSLDKYADEDGIVCINPIKGEQPAAERLQEILVEVYGEEWNSDRQSQLLKSVGFGGKNLEDWFRNGFFQQHCRIFKNRPFIWQIWDGRKDGFSALVNYHSLNKPTLEKLTFTYLGDWIVRQKSAVEAGEEGSDARLISALELKRKLVTILEGEPPYDIFIRWKPIEKQPIGWNPDLNDGVRMNIRPFIIAGILRKNPNINWKKDRGKDVESAPWYHLFKGDRINDHHLTLEEKRSARNMEGENG